MVIYLLIANNFLKEYKHIKEYKSYDGQGLYSNKHLFPILSFCVYRILFFASYAEDLPFDDMIFSDLAGKLFATTARKL